MKIVFFSSNSLEVERVGREFVSAGIECHLFIDFFPHNTFPSRSYSELWIQDDKEYPRALRLCAELGLRPARWPARAPLRGAAPC